MDAIDLCYASAGTLSRLTTESWRKLSRKLPVLRALSVAKPPLSAIRLHTLSQEITSQEVRQLRMHIR